MEHGRVQYISCHSQKAYRKNVLTAQSGIQERITVCLSWKQLLWICDTFYIIFLLPANLSTFIKHKYACVCSSFQMDNKKISHFHLYFSPLAMVTILKIKLHKVAGRFWQRSMQVHQWKCNYPLYQVFHL